MNRTQYALEVLLNLSEYLKSQLETEEDRKIKSEIYTYLILINSIYKVLTAIDVYKTLVNNFMKEDLFDFTESVIVEKEE